MSTEPGTPAPFYHRVSGVDIRSLPLGPEEAFVLSRVDGRSNEAVIAGATGMSAARVCEHLRRLEELGAVRRAAPAAARSASAAQGPARAPLTPSRAPTRAPSASRASIPARPAAAPGGRAPLSSTPGVQVSPPPRVPAAPARVQISPPPRAPASPPPSVPLSPAPRMPASAPAQAGATVRAEATATPLDPSALEHPEIDASLSISVELQARILDLCARLGELDHFELLGLTRSADRAAIKRAYFSMIGDFHPDRYFGKQLGGFTKRMERIFQRLTEAHDVLSNRQSREEYEAYLSALGRTRSLDSSLQPPGTVEDLERLLQQAEEAARQRAVPAVKQTLAMGSAPSGNASSPASLAPVSSANGGAAAQRASAAVAAAPAPPPAAPARPALKPPPLPGPPRLPSHRPLQLIDDPVARRQALARKFGRAPAPSSPPPASDAERSAGEARRAAAARDLQQRYEHRKGAIRDQRVDRYTKAAEEAIAAGNHVAALNTIKLARSLSGGDLGVMAHLDELEKQLGSTVADSYLQRAQYEESNGAYAEAARSYTRAARGRPHADVLRSAAECYLKAGVELRLAGELAKEAVQMAPDRSDLRLTLAKIYEAAGMPQSAVRELERAHELSPESTRINEWLKRLKRGGV